MTKRVEARVEPSDRIDTIDMVRHIREAHAVQVEGKSARERIAFYRKKARALLRKTSAGRSRRAKRSPGRDAA